MAERFATTRKAWGIYSRRAGGLLGNLAWRDMLAMPPHHLRVPCFTTRAAAREAVKTCFYRDAKVVRIRVAVEVIGRG